jgi:GT2 family glycosyltransferase
MVSLTVVIVTAKPDMSLSKCLASLAVQNFTDFEVIVVCSGCTAPERPGSLVAGRLAKRTRFIATTNRGYGAACNVGAHSSEAAYLVFLNDDTQLHPDCLRSLYDSLSKDENSVLQPLIFHEYTRRAMRGNPCDIYGAAGLWFYGNCGKGEFYVSGASLAVSKRIFDLLGGFDERLFLYHDDLDLSWRARLMAYGISCVESAICKHTGGASSRKMPHALKFYLTQRNRIRVMIKNYSTRRMLTRVGVACLMIIAGGTFLTITTRKAQYVILACKTFAWNLLQLKGTLVERHRVQRKRVQNDEVVERSMSRFSMDLCVLKRHLIGT